MTLRPCGFGRGLGFVLLIAAALLVSPIASVPSRAQTSAVLRIGVLDTVDSLNPFIASSESAHILTAMLYDYLFSFDQNGSYVPNIATGATCDAACTNWTYTVRQGVFWSDGTELTASDVAFTINYAMQNFGKLNAFELYLNQVVACRSSTKPHCGAVVTAPWTVTVYFSRPFVAGQGLFVPILQQAQWQGITAKQAATKFANPTPIGTGPFIADPNIYTEWLQQPGVPLHVIRNPLYHAVGSHAGATNLTDVYLYVFPDVNSMILALETGSIDLAEATHAGFQALQGVPSITGQETLPATQASVELGFQQLSTNNVDGKLNPARWDMNVRRAVAMATNKDFVAQNLYEGAAARGADLTSPVIPQWFYDPTLDSGANLTYNITAANALLDAAGYTAYTIGGSGDRIRVAAHDITFASANGQLVTVPAGTSLNFTLAVAPGNFFPEQVLSANYLQVTARQIGVEFRVKQESTLPNLQSDIFNGNVEAFITSHVGDPDPSRILSEQSGFTLDGHNDNFLDNATFNRLYLAQLGDQSLAQREADVQGAQATHYRLAAYIVLVYPYGSWAWRTDTLTGWGDWIAHPFRQIDNIWGANPLFFDLAGL